MSDKEARIAFEHRIAKACHMTYEEVTRRFNEYENITGRRYGEHGINQKEWDIWLEEWKAAKQQGLNKEFQI